MSLLDRMVAEGHRLTEHGWDTGATDATDAVYIEAGADVDAAAAVDALPHAASLAAATPLLLPLQVAAAAADPHTRHSHHAAPSAVQTGHASAHSDNDVAYSD